jgi:predicted transcriptional regulator
MMVNLDCQPWPLSSQQSHQPPGRSVIMLQAPRTLLLSVRPRFADAILHGRKSVELRRGRVGAQAGAAVILYATAPTMAILGTAFIKDVDTAAPSDVWERHCAALDLDHHEFKDYTQGCRVASALVLEQPAQLLAPVHISVLRSLAPFQPPQSYRYVTDTDPVELRNLSPELSESAQLQVPFTLAAIPHHYHTNSLLSNTSTP